MRAHISLNVRDVRASVDFYRGVFGVPPQKQTGKYAHFDLQDPPLNLGMQSVAGAISRVNHFGIEVDSPAEVAKWGTCLRAQGMLEATEEGVLCCYVLQEKVWFRDPDGKKWEVFTVLEQVPRTAERAETPCYTPACCT